MNHRFPDGAFGPAGRFASGIHCYSMVLFHFQSDRARWLIALAENGFSTDENRFGISGFSQLGIQPAA
jgi:hypothetical protein